MNPAQHSPTCWHPSNAVSPMVNIHKIMEVYQNLPEISESNQLAIFPKYSQTRSADAFSQLPLLIINITPLRAKQNEKFSSDPPPLRLENNEFLARPKVNFTESKNAASQHIHHIPPYFIALKGKQLNSTP